MPTTVIYSDAADGYVQSSNATYATMAAGSNLITSAVSVAMTVGQDGVSDSGLTYGGYEAFIAFDTSTVVSPQAVELWLTPSANLSVQDFVLEARLFDWGTTLTTGDYQTPSALGSLTLAATRDTADGITVNASMKWTESGSALKDGLNLSGFTRLVLSSDRFQVGTVPTSQEYLGIYSTNESGTSFDPRLVILTPSTDDILNPGLDITTNDWTTGTGGLTNLYAAIDELTASDTDYIRSPTGPTTAQFYETMLEGHADPASSSGHIVHYRYQKNISGGNVNLTVGLLQGLPSEELLTADQAEFETATGGWTSVFGSVARTTAQFRLGIASLAYTSNGVSGNIQSPTGSSGIPVTAGDTVVLSGYTKAAVTARSWYIQTAFYNSGGFFLANGPTGSTVLNSTSTWTQHELALVPPAGAFFLRADFRNDTSTNGEVTYFDSMGALNQPAATVVDSWAHTNIPNTWTQQDQTLSGAEADSITNYSDLRLRFTPNMVTSDQVAPVPTFVADRASANSNTAVTTVDLVLASLTVGNYLIIRSAADNSGGGGAARTFVVSNQSGTAMGTHTEYQQNNDPGAASAGVTCNVSVIKIAATSGTIRLTYGGSVVQACVAEEWSGIHATTPIVGTPVGANGTASTNLASLSESSAASGNVVYGVEAVEGPSSDTYTQDTDTNDGPWVGITKLGTSNATADTNQTIYGAYKAGTSTAPHIYNPTINIARDSAGLLLELAAAPTPSPTIRTQVSWANMELPSSAPAILRHIWGAQIAGDFVGTGATSFGAGDA